MCLILHPCQAKFFDLEWHPSCLKSRVTNPEMPSCFLFYSTWHLSCSSAFAYPGSRSPFSTDSCTLRDSHLSRATYREPDTICYTKCLFCCLKYSILTIPAGFNIQKLKHCWAGTPWDFRAECKEELLRKKPACNGGILQSENAPAAKLSPTKCWGYERNKKKQTKTTVLPFHPGQMRSQNWPYYVSIHNIKTNPSTITINMPDK